MVVGTALTIAGLAAFIAVNVISMYAMFMRRNELLVKARSPHLALCYGVTMLVCGIILFCQEILRQYNMNFPESIIIWCSCISFSLVGTSSLLRAARVLIITSAEHRKRYLKFLTTRSQVILSMSSLLTSSLPLGLVIELTRRNNGIASGPEYKYFCQPSLLFFVISLASAVPGIKFASIMIALNDALGVGREIVRCVCAICFTYIPYFVIVCLYDRGIIKHLDTRVHVLVLACGLYINLDTFILSRSRWVRYGSTKVSIDPRLMDGGSGTSALGLTSINILVDPDLSPLYSKHVERNLCFESWAFLQEASEFRQTVESGSVDVHEQHRACIAIVDQFIVPGSSLEINVGMSLQKPVLAKAKEFEKLSEEERASIFDACIKEVGKVLDQNLLVGFQNTQGYKDAMMSRTRKSPVSSDRKTRIIRMSFSSKVPDFMSGRKLLKSQKSSHEGDDERLKTETTLINLEDELKSVVDIL